MGDFQPTNSHPLDDRECFVCYPCLCYDKSSGRRRRRNNKECHCVFSPQANTTIISRVTPAPGFTTDYADVYVSGVTRSDVKDKARLIKNFDEFDFPNNFNLERYKKPTPIQKAAIPIMMEGKDLVAVSQTGSGKTIWLDVLRYLIIDEADTILRQFEKDHNMHELKRIIKENQVQTALFCAVMPDFVIEDKKSPDAKKYENKRQRKRKPRGSKRILYHEKIKEYLKEDYIHVSVKKSDSFVKEISQEFYKTKEEDKLELLKEVLGHCLMEKKRVIVFVEMKIDTAYVAKCLCKSGYPVTVMHSNRSQKDRELSLYLFNEDHTPIMICTSVTAHGFDIPEIDTVVNFNLPGLKWDNFSTYLYRVGRAGRAGNPGTAVSFFVPKKDEWLAPAVVTELVKKQIVVPKWLNEMCKPENIDPSLKKEAILAMRDSAVLVERGRGAKDSRISVFEMITQVEGDKHTELNVERVHRGK